MTLDAERAAQIAARRLKRELRARDPERERDLFLIESDEYKRALAEYRRCVARPIATEGYPAELDEPNRERPEVDRDDAHDPRERRRFGL